MQLYDNPVSPYAFKVRATLYEKGVDVEAHEIKTEADREALLRVSPRGEVPALVDGETVVYDSTIICEYLEERFPTPPLLPADPAVRSEVRALERICDTQIDPAVLVVALIDVFRPELKDSHADSLARATATLDAHWADLDQRLAGRDFLAGEFSRADIALMPHVAAVTFMGHAIPTEHANLTGWAGRMQQRPSIARATEEALATFTAERDLESPFFDPHRLHWRDARIEWLIRCGLGPWLLAELEAGRAFFSPIP